MLAWLVLRLALFLRLGFGGVVGGRNTLSDLRFPLLVYAYVHSRRGSRVLRVLLASCSILRLGFGRCGVRASTVFAKKSKRDLK